MYSVRWDSVRTTATERHAGGRVAIGPVPLAVTINLNINFLRKPMAGDLLAEARLLKLGARLATGEVTIRSVNGEAPIAHVTSTYSIPPNSGRHAKVL